MEIHDDLGYTYTDRITKFTGVAITRCEYLSGCVHLCLERADKDGMSQSDYFDIGRLTKHDDVERIVHADYGQVASPQGPYPRSPR